MKPHYIYILATIFCLASCTQPSKHEETLMQVESFIVERPDSALAVLQGIDTRRCGLDYCLFVYRFLRLFPICDVGRIVCIPME